MPPARLGLLTMLPKNIHVLRLAGLLLVAVAQTTSGWAKPALSLLSASVMRNSSVAGFEFSTCNPITVTHLGIFDGDKNRRVTAPTQVGIWSADSRTLLISAIIPKGTNAALENKFLYLPITPVTLAPGSYVISAQSTNGEPVGYDAQIFPASEINWICGRNRHGNEWEFPDLIRIAPTAYIGPNFKFEVESPVQLSSPTARVIYQRNKFNAAEIPIAGTCNQKFTSIEARAIVLAGGNGTAANWQTIDAAPSGDSFSGTLTLDAGGWYQVEVRAMNDDVEVGRFCVSRVGVGEVFVIAGQSNAANSGRPRLVPTDDRISSLDFTNGWRWAYDPQPIASDIGGSPWPAFGDFMVQRYNVPIGLICVAVGGTRIDEWQPGGTNYLRIVNAVSYLGPHGFRALLWHQGERDSFFSTTTANYFQRLTNLIVNARLGAGWNFPWGIALDSYNPNTTAAQEAPIIAGQRLAIASNPLNFKGAETDNLKGPGWRWDGVHFTAAGLHQHAWRWANAITEAFGGVNEIILDDTNATFSGKWTSSSVSMGRFGNDYFSALTGSTLCTATYRPTIIVPGYYDIFLWYPSPTIRSTNAQWTISCESGTLTVPVNQSTNGGSWRRIATSQFFAKGTNGTIRLSNLTGEKTRYVVAGAVRLSFTEPKMFHRITAIVSDGTNVFLSWPGRLGIQLQKATRLDAPDWQDILDSLETNQLAQPLSGNSFYRLIQK